jgi:ribosomal-protein-serine acetyltransferase
MILIPVEDDLEMRLVRAEDADELCALVKRNHEHLHGWMQWAIDGYSIGHTRSFIEQSRRDYAKGNTLNLLILQSGAIIGGSGLNFIDRVNRGTEIGYWLDEAHTGRGIVTKCCRALIEYAFDELEMHRIVIRCASGNLSSRAIPERLGFTVEGTLRESEWLHDRFVDLIVYSLLRPEWAGGER